MKIIKEFKGEYRFLSNFYPCDILLTWNEDIVYVPTVEHAYQASKAMNRKDFDAILLCNTPGEAKRIGQKIVLRSAWVAEEFRLDIMLGLIQQKFSDSNPALKQLLINTGQSYLIEGNYWHDNFWGVCYCSKCVSIEGQNHLGKIIMGVRGKL